jgi:hypothetical protein
MQSSEGVINQMDAGVHPFSCLRLHILTLTGFQTLSGLTFYPARAISGPRGMPPVCKKPPKYLQNALQYSILQRFLYMRESLMPSDNKSPSPS